MLAATVQMKAWDGRFSSANKDWAFIFDFPEPVNEAGFDRRDSYAITTHPAVLDGFINLVRQKIRERMVPVEKTEAAAEPALPKKPDDPIVGNAMAVRAGDEQLELLTEDEAKRLASALERKRDRAIEKVSRAFGLAPVHKADLETPDPHRRQPCGKDHMER